MTIWRAAAGAATHRTTTQTRSSSRDIRMPRSARCAAEADLRHFAFGRRGDLEELARLEIEHARENIGRKLSDLGVEVSHDRVVIAARVLDVVFERVQCLLKLVEAL